MHRKVKVQDCVETTNLDKYSDHLSRNQVGYLFPLRKYLMAEVEEVEVHTLEYHRIEEVFEDKDSEVFDTILLNGSIDLVKIKLKVLKDQGMKFHGVFRSFFHFSLSSKP